MVPSRIYLTGASGFVGASLLSRLSQGPYICTVAMRRALTDLPASVQVDTIAALNAETDFHTGLVGQEVVIHCAGRAHVMHEDAEDPLTEFRAVNLHGTLNLARQAADAGVKRFIFLSSIKVNGEQTQPCQPYTADSAPMPQDAYGISKHEAEQALQVLASETGMKVVIIRPVLVYGPAVKANFLNMMTFLAKGFPLPLGAIHNRRSLVALDNLIDLIVTCIEHPAAANQTFLVSDGEDLSTTELLRRMGAELGKPACLLPVPSWLLKAGTAIVGKQALSQRLCGSLQVDIRKTRELLNWAPPVSVDEALRKTAKHFLEQQNK